MGAVQPKSDAAASVYSELPSRCWCTAWLPVVGGSWWLNQFMRSQLWELWEMAAAGLLLEKGQKLVRHGTQMMLCHHWAVASSN